MKKNKRNKLFKFTFIMLVMQMLILIAPSSNVVKAIENQESGQVYETFNNNLFGSTFVAPKHSDSYYAGEVVTVNTVDEAAQYVRKQMVKRSDCIRFKINVSYYNNLIKDIYNKAVSYNDSLSSDEGDYLRWSFSGYSCGGSFYDGGVMLQYDMAYLTTYQQELAVKSEVKKVLDSLNVYNKDEYTKLKAVHDYIVTNIQYDYSLNNYSAYNAIVEKNVVCQGFSLLTYKMLKDLGVGTRIITGLGNGGNHAWNIASINGKWYNLDNTWDENYTAALGEVSYDHFLKTESDFAGHIREPEYTTADFNKKYPMAGKSFNPQEVIKTGWVLNNGNWYYYNSNGAMQKGWLKLNTTYYYFKADGAMVTGWQKVGQKWYYFNGSGAMQTGWLKLNNTYYYLKADGEMLTSWQKVGQKWYFFDNSGAMKTGWAQLGGKWYFFKADGEMSTNTVIGNWRIDANGVATQIA